jgi:glycosyltransferase involved in cell wall biosynthesis
MNKGIHILHTIPSCACAPKVLAILPELIPSSFILVIEPLLKLIKLDKVRVRVRLESVNVRYPDLKWADIVIFCRNASPGYDNILDYLLSDKKPYIYEIDDDLFALPQDVPGREYHSAPERIAKLEKFVTNASLVRVYSSPMETRIRQFTTKVKFRNAPVNLDLFPNTAPHRVSRKLRIIYATSRTSSDNLSMMLVNDLIRLINNYGKCIEIHFWGFVPDELKRLPSVKFHRFISNYQKYLKLIYNQGYDIGLAPMKNDLFYASKTNNKFREYGACWIAGIYSDSDVYANCVEDSTTGLLISTEGGEWYKAIVKLMHDSNLRQSIQRNARIVVEREYSLNSFAQLLLEDINQVIRESRNKVVLESLPLVEFGNQDKHYYIGLINKGIFALKKIHASVNYRGYHYTYRLILKQIEQLIGYIGLSLELVWLQKIFPLLGKK